MSDTEPNGTYDPKIYFPRIEQYMEWYDKKAVWAKSRYMQSKITIAVCAVLIPIISGSKLFTYFSGVENLSIILVTFLGIIIALLVALENVLKYKDQWVNYRSTEQFLVREKILYETNSGPYETLDAQSSFRRFISVCEDAIQNENQATLSVLTREESSGPTS